MQLRQFVAILGAVTLLVGVFLPVLFLEAGIVNVSLSLFDVAGLPRVMGWLLVGFGAAVIVLAFLGKVRLLVPLGFGALLATVIAFINLQVQIADARRPFTDEIIAFRLGVGWALLLAGALLIIGAGLRRESLWNVSWSPAPASG